VTTRHGLNCNQVQTSAFSVSACKLETSDLAVAVQGPIIGKHDIIYKMEIYNILQCHQEDQIMAALLDGLQEGQQAHNKPVTLIHRSSTVKHIER